jgi:hypothetical protein
MSDSVEKVKVQIVFGFQLTKVGDEGELETTTFEPGQEVELEKDVAREQAHLNRVRIVEESAQTAATDVASDNAAEAPSISDTESDGADRAIPEEA